MDSDKNSDYFDKALTRAKEEIKILENSLHKQSGDLESALQKIEKLRKENERLRGDRERLKEEIRQLKSIPDWVKPNKTEDAKRTAKKLGAKNVHNAHPRKMPEHIDREVKVVPKKCPHCDNDKLSAPSKWDHRSRSNSSDVSTEDRNSTVWSKHGTGNHHTSLYFWTVAACQSVKQIACQLA